MNEILSRFLTFDFTNVSTSSSFDSSDLKDAKYVKRKKFGITVDWLDGRHYDADELEQYRMVGDVEMDYIIKQLDGESRKDDVAQISPKFRFMNVVDECEDVYKIYKIKQDALNQMKMEDPKKAMYEFYRHYHDNVPSWVDWDQIQRGIDIFILFSPAAGQSLFYLSLVPGFSIPKIAQVLQQTRYLAPPSTNKQVNKRLQDTGGFLMSCMVDENNDKKNTCQNSSVDEILSASSLRPGNTGWKMALRVRVLHAKVRRLLLNAQDKSKWDVNKYGIPINQEDMAATLLAFCINVLSGLEVAAGTSLPLDEQRDYIALWRYIGWLLGVSCDEHFQSSIHSIGNHHLPPLDPCGLKYNYQKEDSLIHARATLESIIFHLMHPDDLSCTISNHLLRIGRSEEELSESFRISFGYLYRSFICRKYVGDELADMLRIPRCSFTSPKHLLALVSSFLVLFFIRIYTLLTMYNGWFRRRAYNGHKRMLNRVHSYWIEENTKRMKSMAEVSFSGSREPASKPHCPFSLVMPPPSSQVLSKGTDLKKNN